MEIVFIFSALMMGLVSSFHCLGMCGAIAISLGISPKGNWHFWMENGLYQFGRISTYTVMGLLVGVFGAGFSLVGVQQYVSIAAGLLLILMALFQWLGQRQSWTPAFVQFLLVKLKINLGVYLKKRGLFYRYLTGVLNGLLPCGMVYVALTSALAVGNVAGSMLYMGLFGLGTTPMMFLVVAFGGFFSTSLLRQKIFNWAPYLMLVMGIIFIMRGLELGIPYLSPSGASLEIEAKQSCCH